MGNDEIMKYNIWLQSNLSYGSIKTLKAIEIFGSAEKVYKTDISNLKTCGIFSSAELKRLNNKDLSEAESIIEECRKSNIKIVALGEKEYPYCLSIIENPPLVLYVKGKLPDFDNIPAISIVGTRKSSEFGKKAAFSLSYRLARSGFIVVSGGALGCDTYAHAGALKAEGTTVIVMGCGLNSNYLPENEQLRNAVLKQGCIISEFPPVYNASRYTFPVRNRIISALSLGTVVVEAGTKSGALITAHHANEQGRDVFVIPRSVEEKEYSGSNALLRDGAKPLLDVSDVFNEYIVRFPDKINIERAYDKQILSAKATENTVKIEKNQKNLNETLSKEAKIVYNYLDKQKFIPEEISGTGLSGEQILSALTELEMEFLIKALPGGQYEKC